MTTKQWLMIGTLSYLLLIGTIIGSAFESNLWGHASAQLLPLLAMLPGLIAKHHRVYTWFCFVVLLYFCFYVAQLSRPEPHWLLWLSLVASIGLFLSAMMAGRGLLKASN